MDNPIMFTLVLINDKISRFLKLPCCLNIYWVSSRFNFARFFVSACGQTIGQSSPYHTHALYPCIDCHSKTSDLKKVSSMYCTHCYKVLGPHFSQFKKKLVSSKA